MLGNYDTEYCVCSPGMTPYEFVQNVYYQQEKVVLDFHPDDDKYKEVLMEANFVLQELQTSEDWTWLRSRLILGPTHHIHGQQIPEFQLPEWVYKPATMFDDCVKLCHTHHHDSIDERDAIVVPWVSPGSIHRRHQGDLNKHGMPTPEVRELGAVNFGNIVTFNRPLTPYESHHRVAVTDVIQRLPQFHICDDNCPRDENGNCTLIEPRVLYMIPDPMYVVMRTAALHAAGSPPAQGRIADLTDNAQKLLSAMRSNDAAATAPDIVQHETPGWISVI